MINHLLRSIVSSIDNSAQDRVFSKEEIIRACISASAKNGYTSLWDRLDDNITIEHFKDRVKESLYGFKKVFSAELLWMNDEEITKLSDKIYGYYLECGFLYHTPMRISTANRKEYGNHQVSLIRSPRPQDTVLMSGVGFYNINPTGSAESFSEIFHTNEHTFDEMYEHIRSLDYVVSEIPENAEFLRTEPPFRNGYWQKNMNADAEFCIFRLDTAGPKEYYLYHYDGQRFEVHRIPDLLSANGEYREYSCSILKHEGTLPEVIYETDGNYVNIKFSYLMPVRIHRLLEMYSWGMIYPADNVHNRVMQKEVFQIFGSEMKRIGFVLKEKDF